MPKWIAAALGLVLAIGGFAVGRSMRSPGDVPSAGASGRAGVGSIAEALRETDPIARTARVAALLESAGPETAAEVGQILKQPQFDYGMAELELLVRFWSRHDAKAAADWAVFAAPPGCPLATVLPSVEAWATLEPRAVVAWVKTGVRGPDSGPLELGLLRGWFASGQPGLDEYLRDMEMGFDRQRAIGVVAAEMIERDGPQAAQAWVEGLPDQDKVFKQDAFRQVASELAARAPDAAVAFCDQHCDGPYGKNVRALIATHWAARDGKAAMDWVGSAPEGEEKEFAVVAGYEAWLRRDRLGATAWASAMGVDAVPTWFRPAVGRFVMARARENPLEAIEWAALIPDEGNRERALIAVFKHWRYRDEAAAEAWLARSPLSEEARKTARSRPTTELPSLKPMPAPPT